MSTRTILDPTAERTVVERSLVKRPASLEGLTIGLLDISKPRGNVFLDQIEARFVAVGVKVLRYRKPSYTKPAPADLRHEIATQCGAVIAALAD